MKVALVVIAVLMVLGLSVMGFVYYRLNRVVRVSKQIPIGPFVIQADAATGKTFNINYGIVDSTSVAYSIWHNGQAIQPPGQLQSNTGLPYLWKVYSMAGTSEPTLIAGSQSLFIVKLKNGKPEVIELDSQFSDFATLQFLDSEDGQPGPEHTVFACSSVEEMDRIESLAGGTLLLVNGLMVLDFETGQKWRFSKGGRSLQNYSFPNPPGILAKSPDGKSIVFSGQFQAWNSTSTDFIEHAMVVFDFRNDAGYIVPFDDTQTRLTNIASLNRAWFESRFEWTKSDDGSDSLALRSQDKPYPWLGEYKDRDGYYYLYPVHSGMLDPFLEFTLDHLGWDRSQIISDETKTYAGRTITIGKDDLKFDINFREDDRVISLSPYLYFPDGPDKDKLRTRVKLIADSFDERLAKGDFQEHFGKTLRE